MTGGPRRSEDDQPEPVDFDWSAPRWRDPDPAPADAERQRRFRDGTAPQQRGAIDAGDSVPSAGKDRAATRDPAPPAD